MKIDPIIAGPVNELIQTVNGYMCVNPRDMFVGRCISLYGEYSEEETSVLLQAAPPGGLVLDIGANIGYHTVPLAKRVGENGVVFAFEPQRHAFQLLCANVALNSIMNVVALKEAVGEQEGITRVPVMNYRDSQNFAGLQLGEWPNGEDTRICRIDSMQLAACDLMKIDVEGWEDSVLRGAAETIERYKPAIYIENNQVGRQGSLIRQLESMGYVCYWHLPKLWRPENFYGVKEDVFSGAISQNMLCTHRARGDEMRGFSRAVADAKGEDVFMIMPDGSRAVLRPTCGKCTVALPSGKRMEIGGPTGRARVISEEETAVSAPGIASRIRSRRGGARD